MDRMRSDCASETLMRISDLDVVEFNNFIQNCGFSDLGNRSAPFAWIIKGWAADTQERLDRGLAFGNTEVEEVISDDLC